MYNSKLTPQILDRMTVLISICSDMMDKNENYSDFAISTMLSAFEQYAVNGKLAEEDLLKYIEECIQESKDARKAA